jgi:hypothetical protein
LGFTIGDADQVLDDWVYLHLLWMIMINYYDEFMAVCKFEFFKLFSLLPWLNLSS